MQRLHTWLPAWEPVFGSRTHATLDALPDNVNNHTKIVVVATAVVVVVDDGYDAATHAKRVGTCVQCSNLYSCCYTHVAWRHARPAWVNVCVRQGHARIEGLLSSTIYSCRDTFTYVQLSAFFCCALFYTSSAVCHSLMSFVNLNYIFGPQHALLANVTAANEHPPALRKTLTCSSTLPHCY